MDRDEYDIILDNLIAVGAITSNSFNLELYTKYRQKNLYDSYYLHLAEFLVILLDSGIDIFAGHHSTVLNENTFRFSQTLEEITIPNTIKSFNNGCFEHCMRLKRIKLPLGLKSIPEKCFLNCIALSDITIPEGVESIESEAFEFCSFLHRIVCPSSLKHIENKAFYYSGIETIELNEGLETIGLNAFESSSIKEITLPTTLSEDTLKNIITGKDYPDIFECKYNNITIKVKTKEQYDFLLAIEANLMDTLDWAYTGRRDIILI